MKEAVNPSKGKTASKYNNSANIQNKAGIYYSEAYHDGRNMAILYRNLSGGLSTFYKVLTALEAKYEPFYYVILWDAFLFHVTIKGAL